MTRNKTASQVQQQMAHAQSILDHHIMRVAQSIRNQIDRALFDYIMKTYGHLPDFTNAQWEELWGLGDDALFAFFLLQCGPPPSGGWEPEAGAPWAIRFWGKEAKRYREKVDMLLTEATLFAMPNQSHTERLKRVAHRRNVYFRWLASGGHGDERVRVGSGPVADERHDSDAEVPAGE